MKITCAAAKLRKSLASPREIAIIYGIRVGKKITERLAQIRHAESLAELRNTSGHCHELTGNRKGQLAINLAHPYRLIFAPSPPIPTLADGGLDWKKVTAIRIIAIIDYH